MKFLSRCIFFAMLSVLLSFGVLAVGPREEPKEEPKDLVVAKDQEEDELTEGDNPFKELLESNGISPTAEGVCAYLKKVQPTPDRYRKIDELVKQLGADGFRERRTAVKELAGQALLASDAVKRACTSADPEMSDRAKDLLKRYQASDDRRILYGVIETARRVKPKRGVPLLLGIAPLVRRDYYWRMLVDAVVRSAGKSDIAVLIKALAGDSGPSRAVALMALAQLEKDKALERALPFCKDKDSEMRLVAAEVLGQHADRRSVVVFIDLLAADAEWYRVRSIAALRKMTGQSLGYTPYLTDAIRRGATAAWRDWWSEKGDTVKLKAISRKVRQSHLNGHTLLAYGYKNKVVELDRFGREVWAHNFTGVWSAEKLANGNVLMTSVGLKQVHEVNRKGEVVWDYACSALNARPLRNGNVLIADYKAKMVIEVEKRTKKVVWQYQGAQSCTDALRLPNGNTLVATGKSVREIGRGGNVVWSWDQGLGIYGIQRLRNGNTLIADMSMNKVLEVTPKGNTVWEFEEKGPCDVFRQPNGNTLITSRKRFLEVTPDKKILWSKEGCSYGSARR